MNDEIIDVCKEINKIPKCTCCGGEYIQDTCSSCDTKNPVLTELISRLNSLIIEFRNQVDVKNITEVNDLFNNLYNLNRYQIPSVNQILIDTNYHEILKELDYFVSKQKQLSENLLLTVGEAIIQNPVYLRNMADDSDSCSLYSIMTINWATARLRGDEVTLIKIL